MMFGSRPSGFAWHRCCRGHSCWRFSDSGCGARRARVRLPWSQWRLAAHSPLVLETAWWYSASSFLWAIAGVLIALVGTTYLSRRPIPALSMTTLGSGLGLAGTTLGILAAPLAILRASLDPTVSRRLKLLVIVVALSGVVSYRMVCKVGGVSVFHTDPQAVLPRIDVVGGMGYALTVPGRLLWPSLVGVPVSWMIVPMSAWLCGAAGVLALAVHTALGLLAAGSVEQTSGRGRNRHDLLFLRTDLLSADDHGEAGPVD